MTAMVPKKRMNKNERQSLILECAQDTAPRELLSTRDLARHFSVSETTIRRDFQEMAQAGLIQRQHGGAYHSQTRQATQRGHVGVLLVSRIDKYRDPFYNMVLEGVDRALEQLGYQIAFVKTLHEVDTTAQASQLLADYGINGLILLGTAGSDSIRYLRQRFAPIVTMTDKLDIEDDLVLFDGRRGMRLMVKHLADLGHRRLGFIAGYDDIRYEGFLEGLAACALDAAPALRQVLPPGPSGWTPDLGERGARNLMALPRQPDAIVCASDRLAIGAMRWLQSNGYQVPQDIAVTGFDNIPESDFTYPPLTTVHVHKVRMGEIAAERIAKRIEDPDALFLKITTPVSLVLRQSCGRPS